MGMAVSAARRREGSRLAAWTVQTTAEGSWKNSMIIPDGPFCGRKAELKTTAAGDWVRIDGETEFCVKDGRIGFEIGYDERDLRHLYDLLRKRAQA